MMTDTDSTTREANTQTLRRAMDGISALDLDNPQVSAAMLAGFADDAGASS